MGAKSRLAQLEELQAEAGDERARRRLDRAARAKEAARPTRVREYSPWRLALRAKYEAAVGGGCASHGGCPAYPA